MQNSTDSSYRFLFEDGAIRGQTVNLTETLTTILKNKQYPRPLACLLGEALAAVAILADTIKIDGALILQVQGDGPVKTIVAQANDKGELRGLIHWQGDIVEDQLYAQLVGKGRLVMTVDANGSERYQGVVGIEGQSLAENIDAYFLQSEQLETRLWLGCDGNSAGGLLLQMMPSQASGNDLSETQSSDDDPNVKQQWEHLVTLTSTVTPEELMSLSCHDLLHRLYHQEQVSVYPSRQLVFQCSCSRAKIEAVLLQLGQQEVLDIAAEEGLVSVDCEFCNLRYEFDHVDIAALFYATNSGPSMQQ